MGEFLSYHIGQDASRPRSQDEDMYFPLHYAILANSGAVENREELIRKAIQDACPHTAGESLVHLYEPLGRSPRRLIELLLGAGKVNTNARDHKGRTALSYAAEFGDIGTVKHLLEMGTVLTDTPDDDGRTPLSYAIEHKHTKIERQLRDAAGGKFGEARSLAESANEDVAPHSPTFEDILHAFQSGDISTSQRLLEQVQERSRIV
jgi:ankyrin repeat protein